MRATPPEAIVEAVVTILQSAIIRVRNRCSGGDLSNLEAEMDHIHNIPSLLQDFRPELLDFYLDTERESYKRSVDESEWQDFVEPWQQLDAWRASRSL